MTSLDAPAAMSETRHPGFSGIDGVAIAWLYCSFLGSLALLESLPYNCEWWQWLQIHWFWPLPDPSFLTGHGRSLHKAGVVRDATRSVTIQPPTPRGLHLERQVLAAIRKEENR